MRLLSRLKPRTAALGLIALAMGLLLVRFPLASVWAEKGAPVPTAFRQLTSAWMHAVNGVSPYVQSSSGATAELRFPPGMLATVGFFRGNWPLFSSTSILLLGVGLAGGASYSSWRAVFALFLGLALSWKGFLETFEAGHPEAWILAIALCAASLLRVRPLLSGILVGILPWLKLPWVFLLMPGLLSLTGARMNLHQKRARSARTFFTGFILSTYTWGAAIPALVFGSDRARGYIRDWLNLILRQPLETIASSPLNQSAYVSIARWTGSEPLLAAALVGITFGLLFGALVARPVQSGPIVLQQQHRQEVLAWISPWLVFIQLLNPLAWRWGSVFLVGMPLAATVGREMRPALRIALWLLVAALALLQFNPIVTALGIPSWGDLSGMGFGTALWLALLFLAL